MEPFLSSYTLGLLECFANLCFFFFLLCVCGALLEATCSSLPPEHFCVTIGSFSRVKHFGLMAAGRPSKNRKSARSLFFSPHSHQIGVKIVL